MKLKFATMFILIALTAGAEAAQSRSSFGGNSKSSSITGGSTRSSFGGTTSTPSRPSYSSASDRSSMPTRMTPVQSTPSSYSSPRSSFGGTTLGNRSSLPTRSSPSSPRPTVYSQSSADIALSNRAKSSGTLFNNRQEATSSFRNKYQTTYTYHYNVQPSVWPTHIPRTYHYNNVSYNILYNPSYSEYGYWYGSSWRHYDPFDDVLMLDVLMHNHDYYIPPPIYSQMPTYSQNPVVVNEAPMSVYGFIITLVVIGSIILVVIVISRNL